MNSLVTMVAFPHLPALSTTSCGFAKQFYSRFHCIAVIFSKRIIKCPRKYSYFTSNSNFVNCLISLLVLVSVSFQLTVGIDFIFEIVLIKIRVRYYIDLQFFLYTLMNYMMELSIELKCSFDLQPAIHIAIVFLVFILTDLMSTGRPQLV